VLELYGYNTLAVCDRHDDTLRRPATNILLIGLFSGTVPLFEYS